MEIDIKNIQTIATKKYASIIESQKINIISQIEAAAEEGLFHISIPLEKVSTECLSWLKEKGFKLEYRKMNSAWTISWFVENDEENKS